MADFHLYIGYRDISSWSIRAWLPLKKTGVPFEETLIRYRIPEERKKLTEISPTAKVPLLVHRRSGDEIKIWDSLAIGEYLAELFPEKQLWPVDPAARALARSIAAEMHSGFKALREALPMDLLRMRPGEAGKVEGAPEEMARVDRIWCDCRDVYGKKHGGPWLFGHFTIADALYAPVATRFRTYAVHLDSQCMSYVETVVSDPDFLEWESAAERDGPTDQR
jgi:glutathione S-transferase